MRQLTYNFFSKIKTYILGAGLDTYKLQETTDLQERALKGHRLLKDDIGFVYKKLKVRSLLSSKYFSFLVLFSKSLIW
jgi:hypothetical protein